MTISDHHYQKWLEVRSYGRTDYVISKAFRVGSVVFLTLSVTSCRSKHHPTAGEFFINLLVAAFVGVSFGFGHWYQCQKRFDAENAETTDQQ